MAKNWMTILPAIEYVTSCPFTDIKVCPLLRFASSQGWLIEKRSGWKVKYSWGGCKLLLHDYYYFYHHDYITRASNSKFVHGFTVRAASEAAEIGANNESLASLKPCTKRDASSVSWNNMGPKFFTGPSSHCHMLGDRLNFGEPPRTHTGTLWSKSFGIEIKAWWLGSGVD